MLKASHINTNFNSRFSHLHMKDISEASKVDHQLNNGKFDLQQTNQAKTSMVFINKLSGGSGGIRLFKNMEKILPNDEICDLTKVKPHVKLANIITSSNAKLSVQSCTNSMHVKQNRSVVIKNKNKNNDVTVLCCGGDGTIRWIMDETHKLLLQNSAGNTHELKSSKSQSGRSNIQVNYDNILFGLIPSGTGNDLFNHLMSLPISSNNSTLGKRRQRQTKSYQRRPFQSQLTVDAVSSSMNSVALSSAQHPQLTDKDQSNTVRSVLSSAMTSTAGAQQSLQLFNNDNTAVVPFDRWTLGITSTGHRESLVNFTNLRAECGKKLRHIALSVHSNYALNEGVQTKLHKWNNTAHELANKVKSLAENSPFAMKVNRMNDRVRQFSPHKYLKHKSSQLQLSLRDNDHVAHVIDTIKQVASQAKVFIKSLKTVTPKCENKHFNNYFGIGIDGAVTSNFDEWRKENPHIFFHRYVNRAIYGAAWLKTYFFGKPRDLSQCLSIEVDGKLIDLDEVKLRYNKSTIYGIIAINIGSYAGGVELWPPRGSEQRGTGFVDQRSDDGLIELVAVVNMNHLAQISGGLPNTQPEYRYGIPIAQGRRFKIINNVKESLHMQVDGEPWMQRGPCEITLSHLAKVNLLVPRLVSP